MCRQQQSPPRCRPTHPAAALVAPAAAIACCLPTAAASLPCSAAGSVAGIAGMTFAAFVGVSFLEVGAGAAACRRLVLLLPLARSSISNSLGRACKPNPPSSDAATQHLSQVRNKVNAQIARGEEPYELKARRGRGVGQMRAGPHALVLSRAGRGCPTCCSQPGARC